MAVAARVGEALEDQQADALREPGPVGAGGEGLAAAVWGEAALATHLDEEVRRRQHRDAAAQRQRALARAQRLRREVHRHQRRGAGGVDRDRRALQPERVGDAAGGDAAGRAGAAVALGRAGRSLGVVLGDDAGEDPGRAAAQLRRVEAGVLAGLPGGFQQQPLLGVHRQRLARRDPEELGVELGDVVEEAAVAGVTGAEVGGVGVVEALQVPAAVGGEAGDRVAPGDDQVPEPGGRVDPAGEAAAHADDRDRLLAACGGGRRGRGHSRGATAPLRLAPEVGPERPRGRVVEDHGRGQPQAAQLAEPVAQLDRRQRVEAGVLEGPLGVDRRGRGVAEDRRHLGPDQLHRERLALALRRGGEAGGERAGGAGGAALRRPDQPREQWRERAGAGGGTQRGGVEGDRQRVGEAETEGAVEEGEPLLGGELGDAGAGDPGAVGIAQIGGHAALADPGPPADRGRGQALGAAPLGEGIEEGVGGGVVALAWAGQGAGDGGEGDEVREVGPGGQLVQVPGGAGLRRHDPLHPLGVERLDGAVVEHPGAVEDRAERVLGGDRGEHRRQRLAVADVAGGDLDRGAECLQLLTQLVRAGGAWATATRQQQVAGTVLGDEVVGEQSTEAAGGAGDEDGGLGVDPPRHLQHDLAGVAGLAQVAEGARRLAHVPGLDRSVAQSAGREEAQQLGKDLPQPGRAGVLDVEGAVADPGVVGRNTVGLAQVGLAHLDQAAALTQQRQRGVDELAGQRVEDDVDAGGGEALAEAEVARGGDVVVVEAEAAQRLPLVGMGGGEDLGAELAGELDRGAADAAGAGVDQHLLPRPQRGEVDEAEVGGGEDDRHRGRLGERPLGRDRHQGGGVADDQRAERPRGQAHDPVARGDRADLVADLEHDPGALAADRRLARVEAEGEHHFAEVESGGAHRDPHLARPQRRFGLGAGDQLEVVEAVAATGLQPPGRTVGGRRQRRAGAGRGQARGASDARTQRQLRLTLDHQRRRLGGERSVGAIAVEQEKAAGVLGLGRADQAPDRGGGRIGRFAVGDRDSAAGEESQARILLQRLPQPLQNPRAEVLCSACRVEAGIRQALDHLGRGAGRRGERDLDPVKCEEGLGGRRPL